MEIDRRFQARVYWFLIGGRTKGDFEAKDVVLWECGDGGTEGLAVPMFSNPSIVERILNNYAEHGRQCGAAKLETADQLTDLLSLLKNRGATHVTLDPHGNPFEYIPIAQAILGFQFSG